MGALELGALKDCAMDATLFPKAGKSVFCPYVGVTFPPIYRFAYRTTQEQNDAAGFPDDPPSEYWTRYSLHNTPDGAIGTLLESGTIRGIPDLNALSFMVRWHPNAEHSAGYSDALLDIRPDDEAAPLPQSIETTEGLFTMFAVPTQAGWPGPLVLYLASYPSEKWPDTDETWCLAIASDGSEVMVDYFGEAPRAVVVPFRLSRARHRRKPRRPRRDA